MDDMTCTYSTQGDTCSPNVVIGVPVILERDATPWNDPECHCAPPTPPCLWAGLGNYNYNDPQCVAPTTTATTQVPELPPVLAMTGSSMHVIMVTLALVLLLAGRALVKVAQR